MGGSAVIENSFIIFNYSFLAMNSYQKEIKFTASSPAFTLKMETWNNSGNTINFTVFPIYRFEFLLHMLLCNFYFV